MMIKNSESGYKELAHTADWALKVWAPDLGGLFIQAAQGMYALMGLTLDEMPCDEYIFEVNGHDAEGLLVSFLEELLYQAEMHGVGYRRIRFAVCRPTIDSNGVRRSRLYNGEGNQGGNLSRPAD